MSSRGRGPAVLLVHPVGLNARYFDGVTSTLVQHHCRVVRFDLPGHGGSSLASTPLSLDGCVACLGNLLERVMDQPCVVVGVGFGAYLGAALILQSHLQSSHFIAVNPQFGPSSWLAQTQRTLERMAADRLTVRTTETVKPMPAADLYETRQHMCRSVKVMEQYNTMLASLPVLALDEIRDIVPTTVTTVERSSPPDSPLISVLSDRKIISLRDH